MIHKKPFLTSGGEIAYEITETVVPNVTENEILHAYFIVGIGRFITEYEQRLKDPSFYCDIEEMEIEKDEINTEHNIFPKQPEPLIVKNESHVVFNNNYKPALPKRVYNTKYFRLIEKPYGHKEEFVYLG
jgi:hypothetical protein